jgi:hypothetical protein
MSWERRHFLKLAFGFAAGVAAFAASARAAPLIPHPLGEGGPLPPSNEDAHPAVTSGDEVEYLKPEEVRGGHGRGRGKGARVLAPCLNPPHAQKTLQSGVKSPDGLLENR